MSNIVDLERLSLAVSYDGRLPRGIRDSIGSLSFLFVQSPQTAERAVGGSHTSASARRIFAAGMQARTGWLAHNQGGLLVVNNSDGIVDSRQAADAWLASEMQQNGALPEKFYPIAALYDYEGVPGNSDRIVHTLLAAGAVSLRGDMNMFNELGA